MNKCIQCKKKTPNRDFCSKECEQTYYDISPAKFAKEMAKEDQHRVCQNCGKHYFGPNKRYCCLDCSILPKIQDLPCYDCGVMVSFRRRNRPAVFLCDKCMHNRNGMQPSKQELLLERRRIEITYHLSKDEDFRTAIYGRYKSIEVSLEYLEGTKP